MKYFQARLPLLNGQLEFESVNEAENNKKFQPHSETTALFAPHNRLVQVILFEINCKIFYTNLHELFCQFISWTNWVNSGKFMDNCWISCQVMADMKKVYKDLIIMNL